MPDEMGLRVAMEEKEWGTRASLHAVDVNILIGFDFDVFEAWT